MSDDLLTTSHCPLCDDARFLKTAHGWKPCACLPRLQRRDLSIQIAHPLLRGTDPYLAESWLGREPWPVDADRIVPGGEWETFRHMAWRSLLAAHEIRRERTQNDPFRVEVLPSWQVQEISFQRDPENKYRSILDLQQPELLIIIEGSEAQRLQWYSRDLVEGLLEIRRLHSRATWIYTPSHLQAIGTGARRTILVQSTPEQLQEIRRAGLEDAHAQRQALQPAVDPSGRIKRLH